MNYFEVKNFKEYQHYKERNPPWIKLHNRIFTDYKFSCLQDASKLHLILIWVLASQLDNKIPHDPEWLKQQLHIKTKPDLKPLFDNGFLVMLDGCLQGASGMHTNADPETYKSTDKSTEKTQSGKPDHEDFERLWKRYKGEPDGKKLAIGYFNTQFKTQKDLDDYDRAEQNYYAIVENDFEGRRLKSGKVWFNNWRDYVDMVISEKPQLDPRDDPLDPLYEPNRNGNGGG